MSEDTHGLQHTSNALFDEREIAAFESADTEAGAAICKMLSLFFLYTVMVMAMSTLVTYLWTH